MYGRLLIAAYDAVLTDTCRMRRCRATLFSAAAWGTNCHAVRSTATGASVRSGSRPKYFWGVWLLASPPLTSHHLFRSASPALPLEVGPLKYSQGVWGELQAPPTGSAAEPQRKSNFVHFSLKIWHLVASNLQTFLRITWTQKAKPSFSANPSHRSLPFLLRHWLHGFPGLFTDTSEPYPFFILLVFLSAYFYVSFWAHVKQHLLSLLYRIVNESNWKRIVMWWYNWSLQRCQLASWPGCPAGWWDGRGRADQSAAVSTMYTEQHLAWSRARHLTVHMLSADFAAASRNSGKIPSCLIKTDITPKIVVNENKHTSRRYVGILVVVLLMH